MSTVARDFDYVLFVSVPAVIAAIIIVTTYSTPATAMCAFTIVFVCHLICLP